MLATDWQFGDLKMFGYDLLLIDPPWEFELYSEKGAEKSAAAHYDTMPLDEIKALRVGELAARDCLVLVWGCACMWPQTLDVIRAWGFTYKTEMVWLKRTRNGKIAMGTGYRARSQHEPLLIATAGNPKHKPFRSTFEGRARGHSVKPDEIYPIIDRAMPKASRAELFARLKRPGWDAWGREAGKFNADPSAMERGRGKRAPDGEVRKAGGDVCSPQLLLSAGGEGDPAPGW
jgi:N6-adenosine-specific RNA methylase IME4